MSTWLRRIRGALGMGLTWAAAWFAAGMALLLVVGPDAADVPFPLGFGLLGFLAGVTFSGVLTLAAGRWDFSRLSLPRFALWGGVGGVVFGVLFVLVVGMLGAASLPVLGMAGLFGLAGAGTAAGSLALARGAADEADALGSGRGEEVPGLPDAEGPERPRG